MSLVHKSISGDKVKECYIESDKSSDETNKDESGIILINTFKCDDIVKIDTFVDKPTTDKNRSIRIENRIVGITELPTEEDVEFSPINELKHFLLTTFLALIIKASRGQRTIGHSS